MKPVTGSLLKHIWKENSQMKQGKMSKLKFTTHYWFLNIRALT